MQELTPPADTLRSDGIRNPVGMTEREPLLTFLRSRPEPVRVVARGADGREWSAEVGPDEPALLRWQGWELRSRERIEWHVEPADASAPAGESASFEMGLLDAGDWSASWISHPSPDSLPERNGITGARYFVGECSLDQRLRNPERVARARVYAAGLGFHRLTVTPADPGKRGAGEPVSNLIEPGFTRYDRRVLYTTYDLTSRVRELAGETIRLEFCVANGWYNEEYPNSWQFENAPWRAEPALIFQLEVTDTDGVRQTVTSDEAIGAGRGPVVSSGLRTGITIDPDVAVTRDGAAQIVPGPTGALTGQLYPPVRVTEIMAPVSTHRTGSGTRVFDMGQNIAGGARVKLSAEAAGRLKSAKTSELTLHFGERLSHAGSVDQTDIAAHVRGERFQTDELILPKRGEASLQTDLCYHGFRYVEATPDPGAHALEGLRFAMVFERVGRFTCSDDRINRLVLLAERSYLSNFHSIPTDCPQREKNGWMADAHLAAPFGLYTYRAESAYRKWLDDIADEQRDDGALPGIVPTSGWGYEWGNGPVWDAAYPIIAWKLYQMRGDTRTAARHLDRFLRYIDYVDGRRSEDKSGLVQFGLGDWVPPYAGHQEYRCPTGLSSTAYFFHVIRLTSRLAAAVGRPDVASRCTRLADQVRDSFACEYYNSATGGYGPEDITSLALPIALDLVDGKELERIGVRLLEVVNDAGFHFECGVVGTTTVFHALSRIGRNDVAWRMLTTPGYPGYMRWLERGATTFWETWQGEASVNHVFFADPIAWLYEQVAGIRFDAGVPVQEEPWLPSALEWVSAEHSGSGHTVTVRAGTAP